MSIVVSLIQFGSFVDLCSTNSCFWLCADVASDWLSCFPISVQKHLYDLFFLDGPVIEVVQVLVPFLHHVGNNGGVDANSVQTNVERCPKTHFYFDFFHLKTSKRKSLLLQQLIDSWYFIPSDIFLCLVASVQTKVFFNPSSPFKYLSLV